MSSTNPTVGRIVWVHGLIDPHLDGSDGPVAGILTGVAGRSEVSVTVFPVGRLPRSYATMKFVPEHNPETLPEGVYATWPDLSVPEPVPSNELPADPAPLDVELLDPRA